MRDILTDLIRWREEGKSIALATVIETWGSSPRKAGSKMAITSDGKMVGSVSGGCVENAVVEAGLEILKTRQPQLLHFGVADETAWDVGLACGGSIDIFVKPLDLVSFEEIKSVLENEEPAATVTVLCGPDKLLGRELLMRDNGQVVGSFGNEWDEKVLTLAKESLAQGASRRVELNEDIEVFFEPILPSPALVIVGGVHIAVSLVSLANMLGYKTILVDPRKAWGNDERFPHVDRLIQAWPQGAFKQIKTTRSTAIVMLTHDPKLDDPALKIALVSSAFYVGALGSKTTHAKRRERLLNNGMTEFQLSQLHAPIGLNIGARSPEEIALSIMAEVVDAFRKQNQSSI